jgi:hypothetical protein
VEGGLGSYSCEWRSILDAPFQLLRLHVFKRHASFRFDQYWFMPGWQRWQDICRALRYMLRLLLALGGDDLSEKSFTIGTACKQCRQGVDMCNDLCYARHVGIFCRLIYLQPGVLYILRLDQR